MTFCDWFAILFFGSLPLVAAGIAEANERSIDRHVHRALDDR